MLFKSVALAIIASAPSVSLAAPASSLPGCYSVWRSGGSYFSGSMVSATVTTTTTTGSGSTATTTTTSVTKNFKCTSGSYPGGSHCPTYDPAGVSSGAAWSDQGECSGVAVTPSPTNKPTYPLWTGTGCPDSWAAGHDYEGGDLAEVDGVVYKCSEALFVNQWCGQTLYKPGDSLYWAQAWTRMGSCDGTISPTASPDYVKLPDAGGCPDDYVSGTTYEANDKVTKNNLVYRCKSWPYSTWCSNAAYEPGEVNSGEAWTLVGYCEGTISPTASPVYVSLDNAGGCPDEYSAGEEYEAGDKVAVAGNGQYMIVYECSRDVHLSRYCKDFDPGHWAALGNQYAGSNWETLGWTIAGYCDGTISPTASPDWNRLPDNNGCPEEYDSSTEYEANDKVSVPVNDVDSVVYKCSSDVHLSRYCRLYEPGNVYNLGWTLVAHCDGTISPTTSPIFNRLTEVGDGCPKEYDVATSYEAGDKVSVVVSDDPERKIIYECKSWPNGAYCNAGENFSPESVNANMGWSLKGYCDGTISPTASPTEYLDPRCKWFNGTKATTIYTWSAGQMSTYVAGSRVRVERRIYKCKSWPYSLYCIQAAYQPEKGDIWTQAWTNAGECQDPTDDTLSPTASPTRSPTRAPTKKPTRTPTVKPTTRAPTAKPTAT